MKPVSKVSKNGSRSAILKLGRTKSHGAYSAAPKVVLGNILVAIDFSERSLRALHYATALARQFRAALLLLHVVDPTPALNTAVGLVPALLADIRPLQQEAAKRISQWRNTVAFPGRVQTSIRTGEPHREIVAAALENNNDLIVLGTHGRNGLAHLLTGSTAELVVRNAACPVLVVRDGEHDFVTPPERKAPSHSKRPAVRDEDGPSAVHRSRDVVGR